MKKKLAYFLDHRFYKYKNKVYSTGSITNSVWNRFFDGFDSITVFGSIVNVEKEKITNLNRVDSPNVSFNHVKYVSTIKGFIKGLILDDKSITNTIIKYDAIVIKLPGQNGFNIYRMVKKLDKKIGLEVVGCPWDAYWNYGNLKGKIMAPIAYLRMKRIVKNTSHVVYVTQNFLQDRYPSNGKTINASNVEIKIPNSEIVESKKKLIQNRDKGVIRIGLMGSLNVKYKGHEELLRAITLIEDKIPGIRIEFVGPGENAWLKDLINKLDIKQEIKFHGKVSSGQPVLDWLDQLDLYIHPSKQEGLPRSVIEAMSRACPVLASSVAGIPELIDKKYLHKPGNYKKLAVDICKLLNNMDELLTSSRNNYEKSKKYDYDILNKRRGRFWKEFSIDK